MGETDENNGNAVAFGFLLLVDDAGAGGFYAIYPLSSLSLIVHEDWYLVHYRMINRRSKVQRSLNREYQHCLCSFILPFAPILGTT
jgi:hypothetical protein